ncbi:cobalt ECF transporter T component CbiQ [Paraconexibacter sp.]|uniref:cobalt ECF transporter T component CbiQ n=1 Tax=Paraconexibacter sp. TaxID=2949640 RepID=UPI003562B742
MSAARGVTLSGVAGDPGSPIHRLDPRAKILGLLTVTVVAVTAPLHAWPVFVACATVLLGVGLAARIGVGDHLRRVRPALVLVVPVAVVVPFVRVGGEAHALGPLTVHDAGLHVLASVLVKSALGVSSGALLTLTTPFPDVLRGLQALRAPRLLVLIAGLMYRYVFVVADEAGRMRTALTARSYRPRTVAHAGTLGRLACGLFLRSYERGERVHVAMLARGYDGRMPQLVRLRPTRTDTVFVVCIAALLLPLRLLGAPG